MPPLASPPENDPHQPVTRSPEELRTILESGVFDEVAGVVEDNRVDFKREPYDLASEQGKYELAKDVAAFANGHVSAVIVIGVRTEKRPDSRFEQAKDPRPMPDHLVDASQYREVIRSRVFPDVRNLSIIAHPDAKDSSKCLVSIFIPTQHEADKPFFVLGPLAVDRSKVQGWLIGIPTRTLDETDQIRPGELHRLIVSGRTVGTRLDELAVAGARDARHAVPEGRKIQADEADPRDRPQEDPDAPEIADKRLRHAASAFAFEADGQGGQAARPFLYLAAVPVSRTTVPSLFSQTGIRMKLEQPPQTRPNGWNLTTLDQADIVEGDRLRVTSGRRLMVELYDDGMLFVIARFDQFLVEHFGVDLTAETPLKVNPLAIIELVHDFVLTYFEMLEFLSPRPTEVIFLVGVENAKGTPVGSLFLPPFGVNTWGWKAPWSVDLPDIPSFGWAVKANVNSDAVGEISFELVQRLYAYFKRTLEEIPYLNENRNAVDPAAFGAT